MTWTTNHNQAKAVGPSYAFMHEQQRLDQRTHRVFSAALPLPAMGNACVSGATEIGRRRQGSWQELGYWIEAGTENGDGVVPEKSMHMIRMVSRRRRPSTGRSDRQGHGHAFEHH